MTDGDVKSTTPLNFSIKFLSLITLLLRPITHRSVFSRPWTLLPVSSYSGTSANFGTAPGLHWFSLVTCSSTTSTTHRSDLLRTKAIEYRADYMVFSRMATGVGVGKKESLMRGLGSDDSQFLESHRASCG
ncbi:hypothetical protein DFH94DRAFT_680573 [Russula ochroleuca]|uniref:Uncharacterized protein n=1 Tax=Russula ochroleuca TaxID=152965 RepID=A0A9P5MZB6_9AGAM|nr:hypothetical protein DFH94DRAFT_680573 [Russula ochroleuca]